MNNELQHYGVLGMKWGVRKSNKLPRKTTKAKSAVKDMTTKDLKRKVERYKLEADYQKYTTKDHARAKNIVQSLVVGAVGAGTSLAVRELVKKGMGSIAKSPVKDRYIWDLVK